MDYRVSAVTCCGDCCNRKMEGENSYCFFTLALVKDHLKTGEGVHDECPLQRADCSLPRHLYKWVFGKNLKFHIVNSDRQLDCWLSYFLQNKDGTIVSDRLSFCGLTEKESDYLYRFFKKIIDGFREELNQVELEKGFFRIISLIKGRRALC